MGKGNDKGIVLELGGVCSQNTVYFADDQVTISNDNEDLQFVARKLQEEYKKYGLNTQLTKYLFTHWGRYV